MSASDDVAVIGGGLIGLAIAFELAERRATVRVYDRSEPARAASWAGAGMLAPYTERLEDQPLLELCETSLTEYTAFVDRVRDASGVDPYLRLNGIVHAAFDDIAMEELRERADAVRERGVACDVLDRAHVLGAEPWLGTHVVGGLLVGGEGHVDNRRLGRALVAACAARGVSLVQIASLRVECDARRALGIRTNFGFAPAGAVVNACGAWAALLDGIPDAARPPVEPVKGQMLSLEVPAGFVRRATWVPDAYFVPRDDGRLLLGATTERVQFDSRVTAEGLHRLLRAALEAAPALATFTVSETWTGLRPGTSDGRPFIGPTPLDGLFVATGHYRNGILLAPVTARLVADAIAGNVAPALAAFALPRRKKAS